MATSIDKILLESGAELKVPDVTRLTTQSLDGTGVFDVLMKSTKLHLMDEYKAHRITGEEYSAVYISALNSVMSASIQYLLNYQQEEKIQAEIALVRQKTVTELVNTDDTIPLGLGFNGDEIVEGLVKIEKDKLVLDQTLTTAQIALTNAEKLLTDSKTTLTTSQSTLTDSESALTTAKVTLTGSQSDLTIAQGTLAGSENTLTIAKATLTGSENALTSAKTTLTGSQSDLAIAQTDLVGAQIIHSTREGDLMGQRVVTELAQTSDDITNAGIAGLGYNVGTTVKGLIRAQIDKTAQDVILTEQKVATEVAQTSDTKPTTLGVMDATTAITGTVSTAKDKAAAEVTLLSQKANTELSQTADLAVVGGSMLNTSTTVAGVTGKQKALFEAQTVGYARDAEQKAAKIMTEAWSIDASVDVAGRNAINHLDDTDLGAVITKLKAGVI